MISALAQVAAAVEYEGLAEDAAGRLLAGLVIVAGGLTLVPLAIALGRRVFPGRNVFFARWGFSHVLLLAGVFLLAGPVAVRCVPHSSELPDVLRQLVATVVALAVCVAFTIVVAQRLDPLGWRCLGWRSGGTLRALLTAGFGYVLCFPLLLGLGLAWPAILHYLGQEPRLQEIAAEIALLDGRSLAYAAILAVVVAPLLEEWLFRGFLQPLLVQNLGDRGGVVMTSFAFAALHGQDAFLPIFGLALLLGALMLRTQRLVAVWAVHGLHNGLSLVLLFAVDLETGRLG